MIDLAVDAEALLYVKVCVIQNLDVIDYDTYEVLIERLVLVETSDKGSKVIDYNGKSYYLLALGTNAERFGHDGISLFVFDRGSFHRAFTNEDGRSFSFFRRNGQPYMISENLPWPIWFTQRH